MGTLVVDDDDEVRGHPPGRMIRTRADDISIQGRSASGVKVISPDDDDQVASIALSASRMMTRARTGGGRHRHRRRRNLIIRAQPAPTHDFPVSATNRACPEEVDPCRTTDVIGARRA